MEFDVQAFKDAVLQRCRKELPNTPSDAEVRLSMPSGDDPRLWVDIVSDEFYEKTAAEYQKEFPGDEPMGEPVFAQYILVSNELLQGKCPEFYEAYGQ